MTKINSLKTIIETETTISNMIQSVVENIANEIETTPLPDTKPINSNIVIVKLSKLKHNNTLSPEFYIPECQAKIVKQYLEPSKRGIDLITKLKNVIENKYIKIGTHRYKLNDTTLSIIKKYYDSV